MVRNSNHRKLAYRTENSKSKTIYTAFNNIQKIMLGSLFLIAIAFVLLVMPSLVLGAKTKNILILNSYHKGLEWTDAQVSAAEQVLFEKLEDIEIHVEYMDTKRICTPEYIEHLAHIFKLKYNNVKFDVIITTDDNALRFVIKYHEALFGGAPVSFCGVNDYQESMFAGKEGFTGLVEVLDIKPTIDLALKLHPGTRNVVVIIDNTTTGMGIRKDVATAARQYEHLKFEFLKGEDLSNEDLFERLRKLPRNSIVLLTTWFRDKNNAYLPLNECGALISSNATVPVYGIVDAYLGHGIVGGKLLNSSTHGKIAAEFALRILNGEKPFDIPVLIKSTNPYMFDFQQLDRWKISPNDLPEGSVVINKPFSIYEEYKRTIWNVAAFIVLLIILITFLAGNILRRQKAENALRESEERYRAFFEKGPDGVVVLEPENAKPIEFNDQACRQLGYSREEFALLRVFDIEAKETARDTKARIRKVLSEGYDDFETLQCTKQGEIRHVHVTAQIIEIAGRSVYHCIWRDITEQKQAENNLKENLSFLQTLIDIIPNPLFYKDAKGEYLTVNRAFEEFYGKNREEIIGKTVYDMGPKHIADKYYEKDRELFQCPGKQTYEWKVINATGETRDVIFNKASYTSQEGKVKGLIGIISDITERKVAGEEREKLQSQLSNAMEMAHLGHWEYDVVNDFFTFNDHFYKIFRTTAKQIGGYTMSAAEYVRRFVHPDEVSVVEEETRKAIEATDPNFRRRLEHRIIYADGTVGHISVQFFIVKDADGKTVKTYGVNQDITERKRAEEALRESENRYKTLFLNMIDGIAVYDAKNDGEDFVFVDMNAAGERISKVKKDDVIGQSVLKVFPGVMDIGLFEVFQRVWRTGNSEYFHMKMYEDKRISHWTENSIYQLPSGEIVAVYSDETERKKAEDALRESENRFRLLTTISPAGIYMTDAKGDTIYVNESWCEMTGLSPKEAAGKGWVKAIHPEDRKRIAADWYKMVASEGKWGTEYRFIAPSGKIAWVYGIATEIRNENGVIIGYMGTNININDRKQMESEKTKLQTQLQQAQKMEAIGTLAGGIAHDFNNILAPIIGCTEMSLEDVSADTFLHENLQEVLKAGLRAKNLVQQILSFSRQTDQELKPLRVQTIVKEVLKLTRSTLPTTIQIQQHISNQCGLVMADATQIHQIAMNLITNAYHAMEITGGKLTVTLKDVELTTEDIKSFEMMPGPYVCLMVTDTGIGIERSIMDRIFEPYYTTKEKEKGTGLGLSVVHGIVKKFGGNITVYSEAGKGTAFHVYLPVIKTQSETFEIEALDPVLKGTERLLLVDDEDQIVRMEKQMLERLGYQVTAITSSIEALELFREAPDQIDLIITDMTMPNMTGLKLSQEVFKIKPGIPIIICTGFSETIDEQKARKLGISGYVMKPVVTRELAQKIREALDRED